MSRDNMLKIEWGNVQSNSGAKCRYEWISNRYDCHMITKNERALMLEGGGSNGGFKIYLCKEHGIKFLEKARDLLEEA